MYVYSPCVFHIRVQLLIFYRVKELLGLANVDKLSFVIPRYTAVSQYIVLRCIVNLYDLMAASLMMTDDCVFIELCYWHSASLKSTSNALQSALF